MQQKQQKKKIINKNFRTKEIKYFKINIKY